LQYFAEANPLALLNELEIRLGINLDVPQPDPPNPLIFAAEERLYDYNNSTGQKIENSKHALFEIMCQLYYKEKPILLPSFVSFVNNFASRLPNKEKNTNSSSPQRSFYSRAIQCLPIFNSSSLSDLHAHAIAVLYCGAGKIKIAADFFLQSNKWSSAVELLQSSTNNDYDYYEIFNVLFIHAIKSADVNKIDQIWSFSPKSFDSFKLLKILKLYIPPFQSDSLVVFSDEKTNSKSLLSYF